MPTEVVMPQMGESITEGTITKWLKKPGDTVQRDEPLFEISTDKVDAEIPSPAAGTLKEIKIAEGTDRPDQHRRLHHRGGRCCVCSCLPRRRLQPLRQQTPPLPPPSTPSRDSGQPRRKLSAAAGPGTEVLMPQMGESITEGTITKWLKKVGDTVQRDEPIFEISTDKVDAEIPSPVAGTLTEIKVAGRRNGHDQHRRRRDRRRLPAKLPLHLLQHRQPPQLPPRLLRLQPPLLRPRRAARAPRRWFARSRRTTTSICAQVPGTGAAGRITKGDIVGHLEQRPKPAAAPAAAPAATPAKPAAPLRRCLASLSR